MLNEQELIKLRKLFIEREYCPGIGHIPWLTKPEAVHRYGCPVTSMAKAKKPWICDCGADELQAELDPLWKKLMGETH